VRPSTPTLAHSGPTQLVLGPPPAPPLEARVRASVSSGGGSLPLGAGETPRAVMASWVGGRHRGLVDSGGGGRKGGAQRQRDAAKCQCAASGTPVPHEERHAKVLSAARVAATASGSNEVTAAMGRAGALLPTQCRVSADSNRGTAFPVRSQRTRCSRPTKRQLPTQCRTPLCRARRVPA